MLLIYQLNEIVMRCLYLNYISKISEITAHKLLYLDMCAKHILTDDIQVFVIEEARFNLMRECYICQFYITQSEAVLNATLSNVVSYHTNETKSDLGMPE